MSDGEKKQIQGKCEEISEKNGWTQFSIDVGTKYPVRLSTKLPALVEQGRAAGNQDAVWSYLETQGGENPNKPGTYYTNRYLEGVEVGGTADPAAAPSSAEPSRNAGGSRTGATDRSIERQVILKEMVQHYPGLKDGLTVDAWWALMDRLDNFMVNGAAVKADGSTADDIPF